MWSNNASEFLEFYNVAFANALITMVERLSETFVSIYIYIYIYIYTCIYFLFYKMKNCHQVLVIAGLKPPLYLDEDTCMIVVN